MNKFLKMTIGNITGANGPGTTNPKPNTLDGSLCVDGKDRKYHFYRFSLIIIQIDPNISFVKLVVMSPDWISKLRIFTWMDNELIVSEQFINVRTLFWSFHIEIKFVCTVD